MYVVVNIDALFVDFPDAVDAAKGADCVFMVMGLGVQM